MCLSSGAWSLSVADQRCSQGSDTQQLLADITSTAVTESTSKEISSQLASLAPASSLSVQELNTVTDLAEALVDAGATNILVSDLCKKLKRANLKYISSGALASCIEKLHVYST